MCGIVGYIGSGNSVNIVLEGLSRLEYRGYDSSGISLHDEKGNLLIFKKEGHLGNLRKVLEKEKNFSPVAIGHTRWATHGGVNDLNAHPHGNDQIAIVHNGIIENSGILKKELIEEGRTFHSQTDSEVFLVLVTKYFEKLGAKCELIELKKLIKDHVSKENFDKISDAYLLVVRKGVKHLLGQEFKNFSTDSLYMEQ
jgi:glucosamine--fructose-6-phosphate aminotransferase (isomerizing)